MTGLKHPRLLAHRGPSMEPALREGDVVELLPVAAGTVRKGDIIAFEDEGRDGYVVHRVAAPTAGGFRTRGDNCAGEDPWVVAPDRVAGRVVALSRGKRRISVPGGCRGRMAASAAGVRRRVARLLAPAYRRLARLSPLPALLPSRWQPRVVAFGTGDAAACRVMVGRITAATFDRSSGSWRIRRPCRFIVDQRRLPSCPGGDGP